MLHMEILRSPLAHARIVSIDTSKAWEIPGVHLVLTGEMMATRNLAWMPTLSYDTQAVLATDKVRFQGQEVACVIAGRPLHRQGRVRGDRRRVRAAAADRQPGAGASPTGAPVIRDDKESQDDNVIYDWEVGDAAGTERAFAAGGHGLQAASCTTRGRTRRRSSAAGRSRTSTGPPPSSPST